MNIIKHIVKLVLSKLNFAKWSLELNGYLFYLTVKKTKIFILFYYMVDQITFDFLTIARFSNINATYLDQYKIVKKKYLILLTRKY